MKLQKPFQVWIRSRRKKKVKNEPKTWEKSWGYMKAQAESYGDYLLLREVKNEVILVIRNDLKLSELTRRLRRSENFCWIEVNQKFSEDNRSHPNRACCSSEVSSEITLNEVELMWSYSKTPKNYSNSSGVSRSHPNNSLGWPEVIWRYPKSSESITWIHSE